MSKLPVKNIKGEQIGEVDVADDLLVYDKGQQAVYEAVVTYQGNQRAATASTLTKSEVAGTNAKPWKQKGTGRARAGYQQSPIWRGGGVAFGPRPRSFEKQLPKKVARLAFRRVLSEKISAGEVIVLDELELPSPKTRQIAAMLEQLGASKGAVIVLDESQENIRLSARNIPQARVTTAHHLNVYDLVRYPLVLVTRKGMDVLTHRLTAAAGRKG